MPSHQEHKTQPNRESSQSSDSNNHPPPSGQLPPQPQQQPTHQNPGYDPREGINDGITFVLIFFLLFYLTICFIFQSQVPIFTLTHFAVSGFNVTGPIFTAQWMTNLTIENSNSKLNAYFNEIQSFIYYQKSNGDVEFLSMAFLPPVYIDTKKTTEVRQRLTVGEKEQQIVPSWVMEEMKKERATGMVTFSLKMDVSLTFKKADVSIRKEEFEVFCKKLKVAFEGDSGNGAISLPKPLRCLVKK